MIKTISYQSMVLKRTENNASGIEYEIYYNTNRILYKNFVVFRQWNQISK